MYIVQFKITRDKPDMHPAWYLSPYDDKIALHHSYVVDGKMTAEAIESPDFLSTILTMRFTDAATYNLYISQEAALNVNSRPSSAELWAANGLTVQFKDDGSNVWVPYNAPNPA